jgi:hypothetical protein
VARAVHGLHTESLTLNFKEIDIILVVLVMTRSLPQFEIEHIRSNDFLISSHSVLISNQFDQLVINLRAMRVPKSASW